MNGINDLRKCLSDTLALVDEVDHEDKKRQEQIFELKKRISHLEDEISSLNKLEDELDSNEQSLEELSVFCEPAFFEFNGKPFNLGIKDLAKRKEEAVFDAISFFDKKCPYCEGDLYAGSIRHKIELDHFFPVAKGGQDFPWNLIPICKQCNRSKRDKLPSVFLPRDVYEKVKNYLEKVRLGFIAEAELDMQNIQIIKSCILKNHDSIKSISCLEPVFNIFGLDYVEEKIIGARVFGGQSDAELLRRFFSVLNHDEIDVSKFCHLTRDKSILYFSFTLSHAEFSKYNEGDSIDLPVIRKIIKDKIPGITKKSKTVYFGINNNVRAVSINLKKLPNLYLELFEGLLRRLDV